MFHQDRSNPQPKNRFDEMMFGKTSNSSNPQEEKDSNESADLFETAQLIADTYQKLSPYTKAIKKFFK
ncbi:hypothetical protein [Gracilibacillus sp. YIM 98692]|uniref:hypothetical protein n=1 Tax=Gracilibacillus sp. YIM 98692 TaxID=2663532 RepID=UPI0013D56DE9|nr:hypothetical protein [Gracilibacillus sp. YIM 98692]